MAPAETHYGETCFRDMSTSGFLSLPLTPPEARKTVLKSFCLPGRRDHLNPVPLSSVSRLGKLAAKPSASESEGRRASSGAFRTRLPGLLGGEALPCGP
jgi:hypothetical protein